MVVALACSCLVNTFNAILIVLGICVGGIFLIKGYYIIRRFVIWV